MSMNGLGSLGDDDGGASGDSGGDWWDVFSDDGSGDDSTAATTAPSPSVPSGGGDGSFTSGPTGPTPSSLNCWPKSIGEKPPGSSIAYCSAAQEAQIKGNTSNVDPLGPLISATPTSPNTPSACIDFFGKMDPKCLAAQTAKPVTGGGGAKPSPKPGPVVEPESASIWGNPLVWAGIALAGGVGLVAYKKHQKKKAMGGFKANWHY